MERSLLLNSLVAEILGPRNGLREQLSAVSHRQGSVISPADEYITGVLAPRSSEAVDDIDDCEELLGEDEAGSDDESDPGASVVPAGIGSASIPGRPASLDPRSKPSSIGISVHLSGNDPEIELCATWAWYEKLSSAVWQRHPQFQLQRVKASERFELEIPEPDGRRTIIQARSRRTPNGWRVSIFLVNGTTIGLAPEHHIYQPQLRIRVSGESTLLPIDEAIPTVMEDPDATSLRLLYAGKKALARGHMCAALWKEVDPERPSGAAPNTSAPFYWIDGDLLPTNIRSDFTAPDARTEFVPCYQVQAPDLQRSKLFQGTELRPDVLAELFDSNALKAALTPILGGYDSWIAAQQARMAHLAQPDRKTAEDHVAECVSVLDRIRSGIDLLAKDVNVRLAFCFANKSIATQSQWQRGKVLSWRPFQLAFMLMNLPAIRYEDDAFRSHCDLLWIPTGGGKTEAYLGLLAFSYALRRLIERSTGAAGEGAGVVALSRYTLRLLTIQQFRRALSLVTASEFLRLRKTSAGLEGWRPASCTLNNDRLWGTTRFSVGLWVGGSVTPNSLFDFSFKQANGSIEQIAGALNILRGEKGEGEPAQVLKCPACKAWLALPPEGLPGLEISVMHFVVGCASPAISLSPSSYSGLRGQTPGQSLIEVTSVSYEALPAPDTYNLTFAIRPQRDISPDEVDRWMKDVVFTTLGSRSVLLSARAARPGYFFRYARLRRGKEQEVDFDIFCPNPKCDLNSGEGWAEDSPSGPVAFPDAFRIDSSNRSSRIPIPAWTVDDQLYNHCPTLIIGTVDKFARLSFEPRAGALFGNVEFYSERHGYYRGNSPPTMSLPTTPSQHPPGAIGVPVPRFSPPDLILQDELHLIEGPLGSMVGIYETVVDQLASRSRTGCTRRPKYIASSATVRRASEQVQAIFDRRLAQFPPPGLDIDDSGFSRSSETHPLHDASPGRLYVGVCAPGRGAQTPIVRIWARMLEAVAELRTAGHPDDRLDPFWTLVGYFNAIRELAGAVALTRQDIPERMSFISGSPRRLGEDDPMELSSRSDSLRLPGLLEHLQLRLGQGRVAGAVVSTSMFGTGVDVSRLGLMVVHGQPKTTSSYIQATGRVGRENAGLVITFYRAARPRDLSHYEYFIGYHRELYRHVEPITVNPFSPRARDRALGPVAVAALRQASDLSTRSGQVAVQDGWRVQQRLVGSWVCQASLMSNASAHPEVNLLPSIFGERADAQPPARRPARALVEREVQSEIARWSQLARTEGTNLLYSESSMIKSPTHPVVLGDLAHAVQGLSVAYENAPNSLREVEATVTIKGRA